MENIQSLNANSATLQSINYRYAQNTGIVIYSTDGYETLTLDQMSASVFENEEYAKNQLINNNLVKAGDPVYKLCTSEEWSIIIQENDLEKVEQLKELGYVKVRFIKNQDESWGKVSTFTNADGDSFVQLTFTNSMITFCRDRYLNVELITEDEKGLKIPNSSIVTKTFFLVPKRYLIINNDGTAGVLRVKYDEQGNETSEIVDVEIYSETDTEYYLSNETLRSGDTLIMTDSNSRFTVSKTDTLIGVYNINKGYAEFRQISILYQNEEYAIVKPNTTYGLNVFDYIVLDSETVDENARSGVESSDDEDLLSDDAATAEDESDSGEEVVSDEENPEESDDADSAAAADEASSEASGEEAVSDGSSEQSSDENKNSETDASSENNSQ